MVDGIRKTSALNPSNPLVADYSYWNHDTLSLRRELKSKEETQMVAVLVGEILNSAGLSTFYDLPTNGYMHRIQIGGDGHNGYLIPQILSGISRDNAYNNFRLREDSHNTFNQQQWKETVEDAPITEATKDKLIEVIDSDVGYMNATAFERFTQRFNWTLASRLTTLDEADIQSDSEQRITQQLLKQIDGEADPTKDMKSYLRTCFYLLFKNQ